MHIFFNIKFFQNIEKKAELFFSQVLTVFRQVLEEQYFLITYTFFYRLY